MVDQIDAAPYFFTKDKNTSELVALEMKYYTLFISCRPNLLFPVYKLSKDQHFDAGSKFFKPKQEMRLLEAIENLDNKLV